MIKYMLISVVLIFAWRCSKNTPVDPYNLSINQLLSAPDTITVEDKQLYLTTWLYRDFASKNYWSYETLFVGCFISSTDRKHINDLISVETVWIVYKNQVWHSQLKEMVMPPQAIWPELAMESVDRGPKWGPNVYVDVIINVIDKKGNTKLLRAPNQLITSLGSQ